MMRRTAWLVWTIVVLSVTLFAAGTVFTALRPGGGDRRSLLWPIDPNNLSVLAYVAVGALIAMRRPGNAVGWLFCAMGLAWEVYGCAQAYTAYMVLARPAAVHVNNLWLVFGENLWVVSFSLMPFMLFVFPSGHLLSRRWVLVVWPLALTVLAGYLALSSDFRAGALIVKFPSPLNLLGLYLDDAAQARLADALNTGMFFGYLLSGVALLLRWRRASRDERQQLKWFVSAGLLVLVIVVVTSVFFDVLRPLDPQALYAADFLYGLPWAVAIGLVPAAAGIAILKYRLYDIDLIVRRTLIYGALSAALVLVYFGSVLVLQLISIGLTGQRPSQLAVVASTLLIAALFSPLRRWVQQVIDRRFYRSKYDAGVTLAAFSAAVRDEVDLQTLMDELLSVVTDTLHPARVSLWLRPGNTQTRR